MFFTDTADETDSSVGVWMMWKSPFIVPAMSGVYGMTLKMFFSSILLSDRVTSCSTSRWSSLEYN